MAAVVRTADEDTLAEAVAERLTLLIADAIATRGSATVSLTGGSTPRRLYTLLGDGNHPWRTRIEWPRLHLFWGDERHVPPEHPDSNFGMANEALLRHVPVPAAQIHRMRGEMADAGAAAAEYERELRAGFAMAGREDHTFDVMLLGLGADAHIASIFPGSALLTDPPPRRVAAVFAPHLGEWRITLTPPAIVDSLAIVMVVAGEQKADAVRAALQERLDILRHPVHVLREAAARVEWFVDRAAASRLDDE
jgi:6-phosphogluconolactonase